MITFYVGTECNFNYIKSIAKITLGLEKKKM